jgi:hypothetical protein
VTSSQRRRDEIPYGTFDMLILKTLSAAREMHGFQIADYIQEYRERSECGRRFALSCTPASFDARLGDRGVGPNRGKSPCSLLSPDARGRKQLEREMEQYYRLTHAIGRILQPA